MELSKFDSNCTNRVQLLLLFEKRFHLDSCNSAHDKDQTWQRSNLWKSYFFPLSFFWFISLVIKKPVLSTRFHTEKQQTTVKIGMKWNNITRWTIKNPEKSFSLCSNLFVMDKKKNLKGQENLKIAYKKWSKKSRIMSATVVSRTATLIWIRLRRKTTFTSRIRLAAITSAITNRLIPFQSSCRYILFLFKKSSAYLWIH